MEHVRQSRPNSGPAFQEDVVQTTRALASSAFRDEFDERDEEEDEQGEDRFTGLSRLSAEGFALVGGLVACWAPPGTDIQVMSRSSVHS